MAKSAPGSADKVHSLPRQSPHEYFGLLWIMWQLHSVNGGFRQSPRGLFTSMRLGSTGGRQSPRASGYCESRGGIGQRLPPPTLSGSLFVLACHNANILESPPLVLRPSVWGTTSAHLRYDPPIVSHILFVNFETGTSQCAKDD